MVTDDQYPRVTSVGRSADSLCELDPFFVSLKAIFHILKRKGQFKESKFGTAIVYFLRGLRLGKIIKKIKFASKLPMHVFFYL